MLVAVLRYVLYCPKATRFLWCIESLSYRSAFEAVKYSLCGLLTQRMKSLIGNDQNREVRHRF